jgi:hypothetical protein
VFPASETMTMMKLIGTILVIGCSAYYAYVRKAEMKQKMALVDQKAEMPPMPAVTFPTVPEDDENAE